MGIVLAQEAITFVKPVYGSGQSYITYEGDEGLEGLIRLLTISWHQGPYVVDPLPGNMGLFSMFL